MAKEREVLEEKDDDLPEAGTEAEADEEVVSEEASGTDDKKADESESDEDGDDERLSAEDAEDRKETLSRRAKMRVRQKAARERARAADQAEIARLRAFEQETRARFERDDKQRVEQSIGGIEQRIHAARSRVQEAEAYIAKAMEAGDGAALTQALKVLREADWEAKSLEATRGNVIEAVKRQQTERQQQQVVQRKPMADPLVKALADDFRNKNAWLDTDGNESDSARLHAIDNQIAAEGYKANTQEYWDVLDERLKKAIPHRFKTRGGPAVGTRSERSIDGGARALPRATPAQEQALREAGYWDDPVQRKKMLARYAAQAKQHRAGAGG